MKEEREEEIPALGAEEVGRKREGAGESCMWCGGRAV
jgi:hypothetical protein